MCGLRLVARLGLLVFLFCVQMGMRLASLGYAVYGEGVRVLVVDMVKSGVWVWTIASFLRSADKI